MTERQQKTKQTLQMYALEIVKLRDKVKELQSECEHDWALQWMGNTGEGNFYECRICGLVKD